VAAEAGTLELVGREVALALRPIEQRLAAANAELFLSELGLRLPPEIASQQQLTNALATTAAKAAALAPLITQLTTAIQVDDAAQIASAGEALVGKIRELVTAIRAIEPALKAAAGGLTPAQQAEIASFAKELASRLFDFLLVEYLQTKGAGIVPTLTLLGIVDVEVGGILGNPLTPPVQKRTLHLERLRDLFLRPEEHLKAAYGWGQITFDGSKLFPRVVAFLEDRDFPATIITAPGERPILEAYLFRLTSTASSPPGLSARLRIPATQDFARTFSLRQPWTLVLGVQARFTAGLEATIDPPLQVALQPPAGTVNITATAGLVAQGAGGPVKLLGQTGGTRLEANRLSATFGFRATWDSASGQARGEPSAEVELRGGRALVVLSDADSFISQVLPADRFEVDLDAGAKWSPSVGLTFRGSAGLETVRPLHTTVGPATIEALYLAIRLTGSDLELESSVAGDVALGPLVASIERIGLRGRLKFEAGNLGPIDLELAFKAPKGVGITIDAGAVVGGGFIAFDETKGRYSGVLQLSLAGISIKAIGILDTKLPGGVPGYSFLIVVFGEFQPIQLGFGFTLNGVGGLAGIHRSMVTAALQSGIRSHSVDHVLFPEDPIRDAPQIVSDLGTIFPPTEGRYVFGPMALIGFGTPTFIEVELGILLEVPEPIRLVLLGQINATLPAKEAAIVELHLDVLGVLDFGKKTLAIDAVLHDSRLVAFDLCGDMALRLSWGDQPAFALSIGGFNPRFQPPPGFPALRRLTLALSTGDNPRFTLQTYLALTSNSLQFGARADLYAEALGFSLSGWLGFDVLVIFSPFSFIADLTAGFAIKRDTWVIASVTLEATFSGPTPWHLWGEASFYFIFRITVGVDITIGEERKEELLPADPGPALQAALSDARNWSAALPPTAFRVVSLSQRNGAGTGPLVDPVGSATVRQRVVPLNRTVTKFGEAKPLGPGRYSLSSVTVGSAPAGALETVQEFFAPAQFEQLSDAERLSRPDFEKMDAGFTVASEAVTVGAAVGNTVVFNTIIVDAPDPPNVKREYTVSAALQSAALGTSASALAPLTSTGEEKYAPSPDAEPLVALADEGYVVVRTDSLQEEPGVLDAPTTKGAALEALAARLDEQPRKKGRLQVVPVHELANV
jgi:hypothetical protein